MPADASVALRALDRPPADETLHASEAHHARIDAAGAVGPAARRRSAGPSRHSSGVCVEEGRKIRTAGLGPSGLIQRLTSRREGIRSRYSRRHEQLDPAFAGCGAAAGEREAAGRGANPCALPRRPRADHLRRAAGPARAALVGAELSDLSPLHASAAAEAVAAIAERRRAAGRRGAPRCRESGAPSDCRLSAAQRRRRLSDGAPGAHHRWLTGGGLPGCGWVRDASAGAVLAAGGAPRSRGRAAVGRVHVEIAGTAAARDGRDERGHEQHGDTAQQSVVHAGWAVASTARGPRRSTDCAGVLQRWRLGVIVRRACPS